MPALIPSESDLSWDAFRYACGELPPTQADDFERRMATDQGAREALARAVELIEGLTLAGANIQADVIPFFRRSKVRRALTVSIAAMVAAAAVLIAMIGPRSTPVERTTPDSNQVTALAWTGLRGEDGAGWISAIDAPSSVPAPVLVSSIEDDFWTTAEDDLLDASPPIVVAEANAAIDLEAVADRALPSWLIAAASGRPAPAPSTRKDD